MSRGDLDGRTVYVNQSVGEIVHSYIQLEPTSDNVRAWASVVWCDDIASVALGAEGYEPVQLTQRIEAGLTLDEAAVCAAWWILYHLEGGSVADLLDLREELWEELV